MADQRDRAPSRSPRRSRSPHRAAPPTGTCPPACVAAFRVTAEEFVFGNRVESLERDVKCAEEENIRLMAQNQMVRMRLRRLEETLTRMAGAFAATGHEGPAPP